MNQRFLSILLVFLLLASVSIPAADAKPAPIVGGAVAAAPVVATGAEKLIIAGITVFVTTAAAIKIGKEVGIRWDGKEKSWENFKTDITERIGKLIRGKQWIKIHSDEGRAIMSAIYYNDAGAAAGAGGGKKDNDKWYFEARKHKGKLEFNPEGMTEEQALKEMGRDKNIMTVREDLAERLINRFNGDPIEQKVDFLKHGGGKEEFFDHANFVGKNQRCHVWIWRP